MSSSVDSISWQDVSQTQTQGAIPPGTPKGSDYTVGSKGDQSDTVKLSTGAQVHQMNQQGYSSKEIAGQLGITVKEVQSYLGEDITQELAALSAASANQSSQAK